MKKFFMKETQRVSTVGLIKSGALQFANPNEIMV